jgi:2-aminoadipate transaminase
MNFGRFDYSRLFVASLPEPTPRFGGFPKYMFVGGHNDPEQIPVERLIEAAAVALRRDGQKLAKYNLGLSPLGYPELRRHVADKVGAHRGISAGPDEVLITHGSNQGIDFTCALFLSPGDGVLVEEMSYHGAISRFKKADAKLVPMRLDADGIVIDELARQLTELKNRGAVPKLLYTIPTVQNPTASILPLDRRRSILALAREYGIMVIEDECYADLTWKGVDVPPALKSLDSDCVIHIGSFSKTLAPALRLGYVVADWEVLSRMLSLKTDAGIGAVDQMIAAEYLSKHFTDHVSSLSDVLKEKLDVMVEAVQREFGTAAECWMPKGGVFLWIKLPDAVDVRKLVKPAAEVGVAFNPGPEWSVDAEAGRSHLRLCFALPTREEIRAGVAALAQVCHEQTGIPAQSGNVRHTRR